LIGEEAQDGSQVETNQSAIKERAALSRPGRQAGLEFCPSTESLEATIETANLSANRLMIKATNLSRSPKEN